MHNFDNMTYYVPWLILLYHSHDLVTVDKFTEKREKRDRSEKRKWLRFAQLRSAYGNVGSSARCSKWLKNDSFFFFFFFVSFFFFAIKIMWLFKKIRK